MPGHSASFALAAALVAGGPACVALPGEDPPTAGSDDDDATAPVAPCDEQHPERTVGLLRCDPRSEPGYTLFAPLATTTTWLIDARGEVVHAWESARRPGSSVSLLPNGNLLHAGARGFVPGAMPPPAGGGGVFEELDWDGRVVWSATYYGPDVDAHHDAAPLPNGNLLVLAWERRTAEEALARGRDPALLTAAEVWPETVVDSTATGRSSGRGGCGTTSCRTAPPPCLATARSRTAAST